MGAPDPRAGGRFVLFSQGFVGLALFLTFLIRQYFTHWRDPTPRGQAQLVDLIHPVSATLGVLQVGTNATSVDDRLLSHRMRTLVADLRARCDFVLIAGPAGTSPEGRALAVLTEATIVVVTGGEATRAQLVELKADLHSVGGDILGAVLVEPEPRR